MYSFRGFFIKLLKPCTTLPFNHIVATKKVPLHQNYYMKRREGDEMATDIVAGSWWA